MASNIIVVERRLLNSPCFRELNGTAKTVLLDFLMKRRMKGKSSGKGKRKEHVILNNGKIEYTYSEAEKRGISRATFMRAIDTLVQRGFIDITHSGSGGKRGDKSLYAISERWMNWGKDEFEEATRPKDTRQGRGFARYWKKKGKNG